MNGNNEYGFEYDATHQTPQTDKRSKKRGGIRLAILALCFALLGGVLGGGAVWLLSKQTKPVGDGTDSTTLLQGKRERITLNIEEIDTGRLMSAAEVYAANVASTVGIQTSITSTSYWGQQTTSASGSGFILTADGYIVTNYHVIEGASSVTVLTYDEKAYSGTIIGYDESNDLAVLKIDASGLSPVILGSSDLMNVGDTVLAIGNPLGELTFSLTTGVVSAMEREITFSGGTVMELLQTDCAINSGNSGGALFNLYGEVIGITNAKYSGSSSSGASIDNIAFAIPIDSVRALIESIVEKGYYGKPYIGVEVGNVSEEMQRYGVPAGAAVSAVTAGGPCAEAGLRANDVITAVDGVAISGSSDLVRVVGKAEVGDVLTLSVWRQNQTLTLTVTVQERIVQNIN